MKQTITIKHKDMSEHKIEAYVINHFAIHAQFEIGIDEETNYVITHVPTGCAICRGYEYQDHAIAAVKAVYKTLAENQLCNLEIADFKTAAKNKVLRAIGNYFDAYRKVSNNIPLEQQIGVFYKDREACEKLRIKINPANNKIIDNNALLSEKCIADLITGKLSL